MNRKPPGDPLAVMSRPQRRQWRQAERRVVREHNARQLATLRNLAAAAGELTSVTYPHSAECTTSAEFTIGGKRIRAARVHQPTLSALTQALSATPTVALAKAGRYGPYWVLTFDLPAAQPVVLADKLFILPDRRDGTAPLAVPPAPAHGRHRPTRLATYLNQAAR
jgi:hypothetical protein